MNCAYNAPPKNTRGDNASDTNVNYQLALKAITMPTTNELQLITLIPMMLDVRPLINFASTESLEVKVPALFLGRSKNDIGIRSNF